MPAHSRYGAVDPNSPEAAARCDRGGEVRRRSELQREMIYAGGQLVWSGFLCCDQHRDPPNPQEALLVLKADPASVPLPRPLFDGGS